MCKYLKLNLHSSTLVQLLSAEYTPIRESGGGGRTPAGSRSRDPGGCQRGKGEAHLQLKAFGTSQGLAKFTVFHILQFFSHDNLLLGIHSSHTLTQRCSKNCYSMISFINITRPADVVAPRSEGTKLILFELLQPICSRYLKVTDGQTDGTDDLQ